MRVKCVINDLAAIRDRALRRRLEQSIHIEGPQSDLSIGQEYAVQALEDWPDDGLRVYLQTSSGDDHPIPYPVEMFEFTDRTIPAGWVIACRTVTGNVEFKRIAFAEWANDDNFYERLIDDDAAAVAIYQQRKR